MHDSPKPRVFSIVGPTASGKTSLSIQLAETIQQETGRNVEIISADSRQVYKHIPIATAQPSKSDLKKIKHHFINKLELDEDFNAGEFGIKGRETIKKIFKKGNIPLIVGGSGLYISSLIYGLFEYDDEVSKEKQKEIRNRLYQRLEKYGLEKLIKDLKKADPDTLNSMPNITERRVTRALEVFQATGIPLSVYRSKKPRIRFEAMQTGIQMDREELYERINKRVEEMAEQGLINEITSLAKKGYHYSKHNSLNTVGVKEVFDYLEGSVNYERMLELIKQNTRRFAKRQMTWFRRDKNIEWVNPEKPLSYKISS